MARRRERDQPQRNALVAGAKKISLGRGAAALERLDHRTAEWMGDAWVCFDEVAEIKHSVLYAGNQMSKLRLFVATRPKDDPDGDPIPVGDEQSGIDAALAQDAVAELDRLERAKGGLAEVLRVLTMNLEVTGLTYVVGRSARTLERQDRQTGDVVTVEIPESWEVRSEREVEFKDEGDDRVALIRDTPGGKQTRLDKDEDSITAIWQRHAAWTGLADCNMRACITDARALQLLTGQVLAEAASAMPAQAWTIPNELTFSARTKPQGDGEADEMDPLEQAIDDAWTEAVEDPTSMSVFRPFVIRGPAEYLKADYLRLIDFKRGGGEDLEKRIMARVKRLSRGLNLPVEKILGLEETTFANADQVNEDEFDDYFQPRAEMLVQALTDAYLRPNLSDSHPTGGDQIEQLFVWYDASRLIAQPDPEANANDAWDRFLISDETWRGVKGFGDDDAPEVLEVLARAGLRRGIFTADISKALLELLGTDIDVEALPTVAPGEADTAAEPDPNARARQVLAALLAAAQRRQAADDEQPPAPRPSLEAHVIEPVTAAARGRARPDFGRMLLDIDRDLRTRLHGAAETAMTRALERAGNRLRNRNMIRRLDLTVPAIEVAATVGPSLVAEAGETVESLLDGAFGDLEHQFMEWGRGAQQEALDLVGRVVGGFDTAERTSLGLRQADDLEDAWRWMRDALEAHAGTQLFDPATIAEALGEFDAAARVPTGLVRQAVARAGGAAGITTDGGGSAFVTLIDGGSRPAGGIATGQLMGQTMRDHGAMVEAFRWVYGPARRSRPFEPHQDLDGLVFENFDDELLANPDSFPAFAYYLPGDHDGCVCDVEPVVVPVEDLDE